MRNMGAVDRILRLFVVVAVGVAYWLGVLAGPLAVVLGVLAVVFFLTSLFGTCPGYFLFGISTRHPPPAD